MRNVKEEIRKPTIQSCIRHSEAKPKNPSGIVFNALNKRPDGSFVVATPQEDELVQK